MLSSERAEIKSLQEIKILDINRLKGSGELRTAPNYSKGLLASNLRCNTNYISVHLLCKDLTQKL